MDRHKEVENVHDKKLGTHWRNNVNIGLQYTENCLKIVDTLAKYQDSGAQMPGRTDMARHYTELTAPDVHPIHSITYCD